MRARRAEGSAPKQPTRAPATRQPATGPAGALRPNDVIDLQRRAGNAAVSDLLAGRLSFPGGQPPRAGGRSARKPKVRKRKPAKPDEPEIGGPVEPASGEVAASVQRAPDPATEQWFRNHVRIRNADFRSLDTLPDDQRQAVLAELTRRYGHEFVRRGQAGTLPDEPPADNASEALDAGDYWTKYGRRHADAALDRLMTGLAFEITGPGLSFPSSERSAFVHYAIVGRLQQLAPADVSQLLDTDLLELVNGVRVTDDLGRGPDAFEPAVTERLVDRLGLGLRRATDRLAVPYALARAKVVADARARQPAGPPNGVMLPEPDPDAVARTQPAADAFGAATTIELAVAEAMTSGLYVTFDEASFGMMYVPQLAGGPRRVKLELERGSGDWKTVKVLDPADASAADVANELFGSPDNAHLVAGRGDHYAFTFPPGRRLAEPYDSLWQEHIETDENGGPLDLIRGRAPSDPLLGLADDAAELRAIDTAAGVAADGDQAAVVQRLEIIGSHLTAISTAAGPLGVADQVEPLRLRLEERLTACAADPAAAQKWSAHSARQVSLLSEAKNGFDAITQQLFAAGLPAVSTPDGEQLAGDVTESMKGPTIELTGAFAAVVMAGDQLDLAGERLTTAKQRLASYPFDMADRMLAMIRKRIASVDDNATIPMESYKSARLDALQAEISGQVAELRTAMINGDATAASRLGELKSQLSMLDLESTIGSTISLIADLGGLLPIAESWSPNKDQEALLVERLRVAMAPWRDVGEKYDNLWQAGKERDEQSMAEIRRRVEALRKDSPLPLLIQQVASFQEDEAKHQRMIAIAVMIAAGLVAALTGGLASGAIGGFAGGIVGAGLEALTFTAITGTLEADQTFGGFMAELGVNFATFGGLRAISGTAKILAAGKFTLIGKAAEDVKLTLGQKAAELTVEGLFMVAATKANEEIQARLHAGEQMTTQAASTIFGHQMLIAFAGRVLARAGSKLFPKLPKLTGLDEVSRYGTKQLEAERVAQKFLTSGDDKLGAAMVRADTEVLRAEAEARIKANEIAANPKLAEKFEIGAAEREELAAGARAATRELTEREINLLMERVQTFGDHVIAEPEVYHELLAKHQKQGSTVAESLDRAGNPQAKITPQSADGTFGKPFTLHSKPGSDVEQALAGKGLKHSPEQLHDYLVKRAGDRTAAVADLRAVRTQAEFDALMDRTLGAERAPGRSVAGRSESDRTVRAEREAARKAERAERNRVLREQHPDWPVVGDEPIRPVKATDSLYYWKFTEGNEIKAELSGDGTLTITIKAKGVPRAGGKDLVRAAIAHFGKGRIKRFQAEWRPGTGYEDNYREYLANRAKNMSPEDAARETWTGRLMAEELGFTHVTVPDHPPEQAKLPRHESEPKLVAPVFSR